MAKLKFFLLSLLLPMIGIEAYAYDFEVDGIYYNITSSNNKEVGVTYGMYKYYGDINIPGTVSNNGTTYTVTSIGQEAFNRCFDLTLIDIANSVTSIGKDAFSYCTSLSKVNLGNSITSLGAFAFYGCKKLTTIEIPSSVVSIEKRVFEGCSLSEVRVSWENPSNVEVGWNAFTPEYEIILYVPVGTSQKYRDLSPWDSFKEIKEYQLASGSTADGIDLGLGVLWASINIGAQKPEEVGSLCAWDTTIPEKEFGEGWRMPTRQEVNDLLYKCSWDKTTLNGVNVFRVTGTNGNCIYLPRTGIAPYNKDIDYTGEPMDTYKGYYWTSNIDYVGEWILAYVMICSDDSYNCNMEYNIDAVKMAIRPVKAKEVQEPSAPQAIDLGLPSGTLWASCNLGASTPMESGDYYAWGETVPNKSVYDESTYTLDWYDMPNHIAGTQYDPAHLILGDDWHIPTENEFKELRTNCSWRYSSTDGGYYVTGPNGNQIFFRFVGAREYDYTVGYMPGVWYSQGFYMSDTKTTFHDMYNSYLYMDTDEYGIRNYYAWRGQTIRPVTKKIEEFIKVDKESLVFSYDAQSADIQISSNTSFNITISSTWISCSHSSAKGDITVTLTVEKNDSETPREGDIRIYNNEKEVVITVKQMNQVIFATPDAVDLGLPSGTLWASCNLGASKPEERGLHYYWGNVISTEEGDLTCKTEMSNDDLFAAGIINSQGNLAPEYDAASFNLGNEWKMATAEEMQELVDLCTWEYSELNGMNGYKVTGPNNNHIFFPFTGCVPGIPVEDATWSNLVSSTPNPELYMGQYRSVWYIRIESTKYYFGSNLRDFGNTVRPVRSTKANLSSISNDEDNIPIDIYNVTGQLVCKDVLLNEALKILPKGLYIYKGKKLIIN